MQGFAMRIVEEAYAAHRDGLVRHLTQVSRDPGVAEELAQEAFLRLAHEVEAGMLAINHPSVSAVDAPFGGVKWSGHGHEDGMEGVMACMVAKAVHEGA